MSAAKPSVVVLDYGSGNLRSAERALARVGADVRVTADPDAALDADGLAIPGVGAFAACMAGLRAVGGDKLIAQRLAAGRPVLGVCVGMQVLFQSGVEHGLLTRGAGSCPARWSDWRPRCCRTWAGTRSPPPESTSLFAGIGPDTRFYFVHSFALRYAHAGLLRESGALITWTTHGEPFAAAVEDGALAATQFHPEKSGDAGATVLSNWLERIR